MQQTPKQTQPTGTLANLAWVPCATEAPLHDNCHSKARFTCAHSSTMLVEQLPASVSGKTWYLPKDITRIDGHAAEADLDVLQCQVLSVAASIHFEARRFACDGGEQ